MDTYWLVEASCWTHSRRYFHDEFLANGSPIAREAIGRMRPLFAIEANIHGQPPEARLAARQARSAPIMAELHTWLETTQRRIADHHVNRICDLAPWNLQPNAA